MSNFISRIHDKYNDRQLLRGLIVFFVLAIFLVLYSSWSSVLPVNQSPDEAMRFDVPKFILDNGVLPRGDDPSIRNDRWGISYAFSVYGSSLIAVPFMLIAKIISGSLASLYFAARFSNNLLFVLALFYTYRIGRKVGLQFISSLFAIILLGLWPQFAFLASYFNSEGLEFLTTAMVVFYAYSAKLNGFNYKSCVKWGLAIGLLTMSYYYAYGAIIASIIYYYGNIIKERKSNSSLEIRASEYFIRRPLIVFACAFLVSGWFFIRNAFLYNGDFIGMSASSQASELYASPGVKPSERVTFKKLGYSIISMFNDDTLYTLPCSPWIVFTAKSSVGTFGYMTIYLSERLFNSYATFVIPVLLFSIILVLIKCFKGKRKLDFGCVFLVTIIPFILSMYYSYSSDWQPQGRYIMAGFPILALVIAFGWETIFMKLGSLLCKGGDMFQKRNVIEVHSRVPVPSDSKVQVFVIIGFCLLVCVDIYLASHVIENYIIPLLSSGILNGLV